MIDAIVIGKQREAEDICSFELAAADGSRLPPFSAGSHIDVHLGDKLVRQYSLYDSLVDAHRYSIAVLKTSDSRGGSRAMHERVRVGDLLQISDPRNHFPLAMDARISVLLAGGIGITPILCMAERLARTGAAFRLHYCARARSRMAFLDRIAHCGSASNVNFHFNDGLEAQRLNIDRALCEFHDGTHLYVCGPSGFMHHVLEGAKRLGWPDSNVHREYFVSAPAPQTTDYAENFSVQIASTGQIITVAANETVLASLARHGITRPFSCESGVCGTCLTRILRGTPDHRDVFMTDDEHARNDQFTPCCSRSRSPLLVLDL